MFGQYFYHEILRKTVIGFGTLFNDIEVRHSDNNGDVQSRMKVPLAYGPMQKFLAKIEQQPQLQGRAAITLPRMSFEMTGISYDSTRKASITQTFKTCNTGELGNIKKVYMPVPYNINFQLSIATKLNDDMLQIIEQILPYFQPGLNITINLVSSIGEKRDVPITLDSINMTDDYEGSFDNRRAMISTLTFTAKTSQITLMVSSRKLLLTTKMIRTDSLQREFRDMLQLQELLKIITMMQPMQSTKS